MIETDSRTPVATLIGKVCLRVAGALSLSIVVIILPGLLGPPTNTVPESPRWPARVPANWPEYPASPPVPGGGIATAGQTGMAIGAGALGRSIHVTRVYTSQGAEITVYSAATLTLGWPLECASATRFQVTAESSSGTQSQHFEHLGVAWSPSEGIALGSHVRGLVFGATVPLTLDVVPFAGNMLFWLLVVITGTDLPDLMRQSLRRQRGLCVRCGYAVGELAACPECGATNPDLKRGHAASTPRQSSKMDRP